jgi:hypothetical protein
LKGITVALFVAAAVSIALGDAAAHHGNKGEHAQPAATRGECTWLRARKTFTSLTDCMKGGHAKRSCRSICK